METPETPQSQIDSEVDHEVVLESLRAFHAEHLRREQGLVLLAVQWAKLNPGLKRTYPDGTPNTSSDGVALEDLLWEELAAKGCPHMDDVTIPAFANAAGITEFQARKLVREGLMLVYLLPRVWKQVSQGQLDVWRARALAEDCWYLTPEAVDYVDRLMSLTTARHTQRGREGAIAEARLRFMPEVVEAEWEEAKETRGFVISTQEWGSQGLAGIGGTLDLPDALELEKAVTAGAETLKRLGSDAPLNVRRSWALGDLARAAQGGPNSLFLDQQRRRRGLPSETPTFLPDCACALGLHPPGRSAPPTQVMMYLHMSPDSLVPAATKPAADPSDTPGAGGLMPRGEPTSQGTAVQTPGNGVVRVEGPGIPAGMAVSSDLVQGWLTRPTGVQGPKIIFRPVIDLQDHHHVDAYEVPDRLKEHVGLRDGGCVFPWCSRPARSSDCDHTIAWNEDGSGGSTCTCNLAFLCRFHHRAKTHADNHTGSRYGWWNYESLGEGKFLWKGPKGTLLLRTNSGVYDVSNAEASNGPRIPSAPRKGRTLADVTQEDFSIKRRVQTAEAAVQRILVTIPVTEIEEDETPLEFPVMLRPNRRPTWLQIALSQPEPERKPKFKPGSLAERVYNRRPPEPDALADRLSEYHTERELFSTPQERKRRQLLRQMERENKVHISNLKFRLIDDDTVYWLENLPPGKRVRKTRDHPKQNDRDRTDRDG